MGSFAGLTAPARRAKAPRMSEDPNTWGIGTRLTRGGMARSANMEMAEALYLTQGYVYDSAESADAVRRFRIAAAVAMLPWLVGLGVAIVLAVRRRVLAAIVASGFAALLGWSALLLADETLGRGMSTYDLARDMKPFIAADTPIYSVGTFEHTLDFYLQRTVTLVAFRDELAFGLDEEPDRGIPSLPAFIERWKADRAPLAIMAEDVFDTLSAAHLPMRIVAHDGRRIVVGKPIVDHSTAP